MTTYSDNWNTFIHSISKRRIAALHDQLAIDPKLALIVALSSDWDPIDVAKNYARRARLQQRRAIEAHLLELEKTRLTLNVAALRVSVTEGNRPLAKIHSRTESEIRTDARLAAKFWTRANAGWIGHRAVHKVIAEHLDLSGAAWLVSHPYGDPTPEERLDVFRREMRASRPTPPSADAVRPAGMTYERAVQIALEVLDRQDGGW